MEPNNRMQKRHVFPFNTALLLLAGFVLLILLFIGFTSLLPSFMGKCVAVVNVDTPISIQGEQSSLFTSGYFGSEQLAQTFSDLDKRDDVGAVLIVFNSPGGSVVATREIYSAVKGMNKPKVSYFREEAASGAYYIASGTDYIVSDPDAITGSIGVITTFYDMSGLLEKVGINVTDITSGPHKDIGSPSRPMTDEERNITQALIGEVFNEFKQTVIDNRGARLNQDLFVQVTDGRILSGRQAAQVGLVDKTGSKKDALMKAADLANISYSSVDDIRVCEIPTHGENGAIISASSLFHLLSSYSRVPTLSFQ